ncbi:MAG: biopolymer transporter ExbD [Limisphaerales bacterium]
MSLKKTTKRGHGTMHELNITPLLDLVFVLLVIFIITTPQMMNNLEMTLPSGKPPPPTKEKPKINKIEVQASGQITLNEQPLTVPELKASLQSLKTSDPRPEGRRQRRRRGRLPEHDRRPRCPQTTRHHQGRPGHGVGRSACRSKKMVVRHGFEP